MKFFPSLLFILSMLMSGKTVAQSDQRLEDMLRMLPGQRQDTAKVNLLNRIIIAYRDEEPIKAMQYAQQGFKIAHQINDKKNIPIFTMHIGRLYFMLSQYDSALKYYNKAIDLAYKSGNKKNMAKALNNKALIFRNQGDLLKAFELYQQSLTLSTALKDSELIIAALNNIALVYKDQGNNAEALNMHLKTLQMLEQGESSPETQLSKSKMLGNIGHMHGDMGNLDSALYYFNQALKLKKQLNDKRGQAIVYHNIATVHEKKGNYDYAIIHYRQSITLRYEVNDTVGYAKTLSSLGKVYYYKGSYQKSISTLQRALIHFKHSFKENRNDIYGALADVYEKNRQIDRAYHYRMLQMRLSDTLQQQKNSSRLLELQAKYETRQREAKIAALQKENELKQNIIRKERTIKMISGGFVGILLLGVLGLTIAVYHIYRIKNLLQVQYARVQESEEELVAINEVLQESNHTKQRLLSLIAHDLKTPFSSFSNTLEVAKTLSDKLDKEELVRWLGDMEQEFKSVLQLVNNMLLWAIHQQNQITFEPQPIPLGTLLDDTIFLIESIAQKKQIEIERSYHFPENFCVHTDLNMIQFVLRNIATNAVKYTQAGGSITFSATLLPTGRTQFSIADTGVGIAREDIPKLFTLSKGKHIKGTGIGLVMCKEFVEMMSGDIAVDSDTGKGTCVTVVI